MANVTDGSRIRSQAAALRLEMLQITFFVQATSLDQKVESRILVTRLCQGALDDFQVKVG